MTPLVAAVAAEVRAALVAHLRDLLGPTYGVEGCCTVASLALAQLLRELGVNAEVACGTFDAGERGEPHTWCLASPEWGVDVARAHARATILDLTADQFQLADAPEVAVLLPGDPARALYAMSDAGESAEAALVARHPGDAEHARRVAARARRQRVETRAGRPVYPPAHAPAPEAD